MAQASRDLKETRGLKKYCMMGKLKYQELFHVCYRCHMSASTFGLSRLGMPRKNVGGTSPISILMAILGQNMVGVPLFV